MATATLTAKGQIIIPIEIRNRYELHAGTQIEIVDEAGVLRLLVRRRVAQSVPSDGYGMVKIARTVSGGKPKRLSEFDAASLLRK
jgi:antitoxin PrlF